MARILIAEDERDIRDLVDFTLKFAGHEVFKVANGAEAVAKASEIMPDLILMDVRMPRMTGYEACRALKAMDDVSAIPVVFLSAKGQDVEMKAGLEAGAIDYILKPFAPDELTRRVTEILDDLKAAAPEFEAEQPVVETAPPVDFFQDEVEPEEGGEFEEAAQTVEAELFGQVEVEPESFETERIEPTPAIDSEPDKGGEPDGSPEHEGGPKPESH